MQAIVGRKTYVDSQTRALPPLQGKRIRGHRRRPPLRDAEELVVYRALYGDGGLWVRPAAMWTEQVERDGYCGPRFRPVGGD